MGASKESGFTLLEAIIALVLMATTLLTLYAWLGGNTLAIRRVQDTTQALEDGRTAAAVLERLNPMDAPSGERELGGLMIRWQSQPIAERRTGLTQGGRPAPYDFALYDLTVTTWRGNRATNTFHLRKMGWEATRVFDPDTDL